ncbi:heme-binding protein [Mycolicibacterium sp. CR10]|uniref:heme-binding protein n=1 Tax=Mycolicibacterium sp. CR10 TaxID=2562314 RepID=UPI0010BFCB00|nr:heme-binding protein [Mycolicibacterium sp. CR10]
MTTSATTVRRGLYGMFAGGLLAFGSAAIIAPVAGAQPAPVPAPSFDCTASAVAGTVSTAAASEGAYLTANPQTNEALTSISAKPQEEAQSAYAQFFAQNPQVEDQLQAIHAPVSALKSECGVTVSPTPVSQAVWSISDSPDMAPAPGAMEPGAPIAETPMAPGMPMN